MGQARVLTLPVCMLTPNAVVVGVVQSFCHLVAAALRVPVAACSAQVQLAGKRLDVTVKIRKEVAQQHELTEGVIQEVAQHCWDQMRAPMAAALATLKHTWWDYHGPKKDATEAQEKGGYEH